MSDLDVDAIEARAAAATEGPWTYSDVIDADHNVTRGGWDIASCGAGDLNPDHGDRDAEAARNAEFIAHARTDVPALVSRIRELEAFRDHVLDVKRFGLRVDLNPTRKFFETAEEADSWWSDYLRGIDVEARKSAARLLDGSETP